MALASNNVTYSIVDVDALLQDHDAAPAATLQRTVAAGLISAEADLLIDAD